MIPLKKIRSLEFNRLQIENRPNFISSASGLIYHQDCFYFVGDDENKLFYIKKNEPIQFINLNKAILPADSKDRKKVKSDFESLMVLEDSILVVPSGSTEKRTKGYLIDQNFKIEEVDFTQTYNQLKKNINEINIEASVLLENEILLFNRGNSENLYNDLIALKNEFPLTHQSVLRIEKLELPQINDTQLTVTDVAIAGSKQICFIAAAEDTKNSYDDGPFKGAILGYMNHFGKIESYHELNISEKPEGLCLNLEKNVFYLVTDADNPNQASSMYEGILP